ncbi:HIT-like protein [Clavulina sp. PMI_390]|nr:HIT-like protein [Clavulina sp. PMI_390]
MLCFSSRPCIFCDVRKENGFNIVSENNHFIAFKDRAPAASEHILVITREHIDSVKSLQSDDVELVNAMRSFGEEALTTVGASPHHRKFGFHIPPFTSVQHIHLHCFGLPFKSTIHKWEFLTSERQNGTKGFSWFAEVSQVMRTLEQGRRVQVLPERKPFSHVTSTNS